MSSTPTIDETTGPIGPIEVPEPEPAPGPDEATESTGASPLPSQSLEVRRNASLSAGIGAVAGVVALAYLVRATGSGSALDWVVAALLAGVAATYLLAVLDARTPLFVADAQGVRLRLGRSWCGMPWPQMEEIEHTPRRRWRDGRLVLLPRDVDGELAGLDGRGRLQSRVATLLHGDPFAVPLALSTTVVGADGDGDLTATLLRLSSGQTVVVEVDPTLPDEDEDRLEVPPGPVAGSPLPGDELFDQDLLDQEVAEPGHRGSPLGEPEPTMPTMSVFGPVASPTPSPLRDPVSAVRAEVTRDITFGATALSLHEPAEDDVRIVLPELEELRRTDAAPFAETIVFAGGRTGSVVSPIATAGESVEPLVFDDLDVEPAPDPVIGPELAAARTRIGLSVDQLAERTRIRPHVIECIEVDDFAPCGGDFYARGHLRTLARVVGMDVAPLLASYDERYADAPISPRRVFEAELATGSHGSIRGTRGGPNWSVLVAAVMALVLAWSIARLVMDGPVELDPAPSLNGSGGPNNAASLGDPVPVSLAAPGGGASIVVKDGSGKTVFTGNLPFGGSKLLSGVVPPVRVSSSDGSATVAVDGGNPQPVGDTGKEAQKTFVAR